MIMKANKQIGFIYKDNESIDKILKDGEVVFEKGFLREKTSTTLPITFGGVGKDLKDYRVYGNIVQSKLPNGYTQVDYIESSGTQYIDTGFKPNQNTRMTAKTYIVSASDYNNIGGARNGNNNQFHIIIANNRFDARYGTKGSTISQTPTGVKEFNFNRNNIYINDMLENTFDVQTFQSSYNAYIFCVNNAGTPSQFANYKLYNMKWYDNDVLVRDFIPCYRNSDNEVGLYDLANNVFYTNQGTGVFTYGSIAPTPDAPIEMVSCGDRTKNLFDKDTSNILIGYTSSTITSQSGSRTLFIKCKPNTTYTISRSKSSNRFQAGTSETTPQIGTSLSNLTPSNFINSNSTITITTPSNANYLCVFYSQAQNNLGYTEEELRNSIQIEEGSTVTSYEPYGYKIPVNVRSDNLINNTLQSQTKNGITLTRNIDGSVTANGTATSNAFFDVGIFTQKQGVAYTLSGCPQGGGNNKYRLYLLGESTPYFDDGEGKNFPIINTDTQRTLRLAIYNNMTVKNLTFYPMIRLTETGNVKYQPYYNETTNIYLDEPLRRIGEYSDYIDFKNGKVVRNIKEYVFDGSEDWLQASSQYTGLYSVAIQITDMLKSLQNDSLLSNYFKGQLYESQTQGITKTSNNNYIAIRIDNTIVNSVANFKTWLQSNNVTVDYVLSTSTEESITLPNIPTAEGNNTLNIETEITPSQVYIKYKSNT